MIITANMATIPERQNIAELAIASIYDQVDKVRVYLNKFTHIPEFLKRDKIETHIGEDLMSSGKFFWALNKEEYYFSIDDDFIYPPFYVKEHLDALKKYNDNVVITLHGKRLKDVPIQSYFRDLTMSLHCLKYVPSHKDYAVHILGAGVSVFNTNNISVDVNQFEYLFMDDIEVSKQLQIKGVPIYVRGHKEGYLKYMKPSVPTLHDIYVNHDIKQTEVINSLKRWTLHKHE